MIKKSNPIEHSNKLWTILHKTYFIFCSFSGEWGRVCSRQMFQNPTRSWTSDDREIRDNQNVARKTGSFTKAIGSAYFGDFVAGIY